eukprot:2150241-Prymnesium_polylepis.1
MRRGRTAHVWFIRPHDRPRERPVPYVPTTAGARRKPSATSPSAPNAQAQRHSRRQRPRAPHAGFVS